MCEPPERIVWIHGKEFVDVTNKTVSEKTYNYTEAKYLARTGREIVASK